MKPNRHNCHDCQNFIRPVFDDNYENKFISKVIEKAKCKVGKRIIFQCYPKNPEVVPGYFRYCDEFKEIEKID